MSDVVPQETKCDFCDGRDNVMVYVDRAGRRPTVHMCHDCWYCGLGPRWLHEFLPLDPSVFFDTSQRVDREKMARLLETMHPRPRLEGL